MKFTYLAFVSILVISCNSATEEKKTEQDTAPVEVSTPEVMIPGDQNAEVLPADSMVVFEDLATDDEKRRAEAVRNVNGIFKRHGNNLNNQASYSAMKFFETYLPEFLANLRKIDQQTYAVWVYFIAAELSLRAPENEIANAQETLNRVSESCYDCNPEQKKELNSFNEKVMAQLKASLQ